MMQRFFIVFSILSNILGTAYIASDIRTIKNNLTIDVETAQNKYLSDYRLYMHRGCQIGYAYQDDPSQFYSLTNACDSAADEFEEFAKEQAKKLGNARIWKPS